VTGGAPAGAEAALAAAAAPSTVSAAGPAAGPPPAVRRGLSPIVWIGGLVAILALLLAWFAFAN
jgi:hypothetical protein